MPLVWLLLALSGVSALKVVPGNEVSAAPLLKALSAGDRRAMAGVLVELPDLPLALAMVTAGGGPEPAAVQKWLSGGPFPSQSRSDLADQSAHLADLERFKALVRQTRDSLPSLARLSLSSIQRSGDQHVVHALRGLQVLGYDIRQLKGWLDGKSGLGRADTDHAVGVLSDFAQLTRAAQGRNLQQAKDVLTGIVRAGGKNRMEEVLGCFSATGDYQTLLQWVAGDAGATGATGATGARAHESFASLVRGLEGGDRGAVMHAFAEMLRAGGKASLSTNLAKLQKLGYDIDAVKRWYKSEGETLAPTPTRAAHASTVSKQARPDQDDAKLLLHMVQAENAKGLKATISNLFKHGGEPRIESALAILQSWGYDPQDVQLLAAGKPLRKKPIQITLPGNTLGSLARRDSHYLSKRESSNVSMQPGSRMSTSQKPEVINKSWPTDHAHSPQNMSDSEMLMLFLHSAKRDDATHFMIHMFQAGGAARVEEALAGVTRWGYDPERFQDWIAGGLEKLVSAVSPNPRPLARTDAKAELPAEDLEGKRAQLLESVKLEHREEALKELAGMLKHGGQPEVDEAFRELQSAGYDSAVVEGWLSGKGSLPIEKTEAVSTEAVRLVGVHDLHVTVTKSEQEHHTSPVLPPPMRM